MSFSTILRIGIKEYKVLNLSYDLAKETDVTGRPSTILRGGRIFVEVLSTGGTELFEWMTSNFGKKEGSVIFMKDNKTPLKEVRFAGAYMIRYKESFNHIGSNTLTEIFTISAKNIEIGQRTFSNKWM